MSGFYGRDKLRITPVVKNTTTGETTKGTPYTVSAYVEELDSIRKVETKRDTDSELFIIIWKQVDIKIGYYIEVIEQYGKPLPIEDIKLRIVQQASPMGGLCFSSWEVFA